MGALAQFNIQPPGNYGLADVAFHPASLQISENSKWEANLLSSGAWTSSNTASLALPKIFSSGDVLRQNILGFTKVSSGYAGLEINGPSVGMRINDRTNISLSTRSRTLANFSELNGRLVSEIGEKVKLKKEYPYYLVPAGDMLVNTSVFNDITLTVSRTFLATFRYRLHGGISLKYINGVANSSGKVSGLTGVINSAKKNESYLSDAQGQVSTQTAGALFSNFNLGNMLHIGKASAGADIGIFYEYYEDPKATAKFSFMISLTDLGSVRYKADSNASKSYHISISAKEGLYFNENFQSIPFKNTTEIFERYPEFFKQTSTGTGTYKIGLSTMFRGKATYVIKDGFYTTASWAVRTRKGNLMNRMSNFMFFSLAPGWTKRDASVSLPLSLQEISGLNAGATFRYKGFFVGSNSIMSAIFASRQIDAYVGLLLSSRKK